MANLLSEEGQALVGKHLPLAKWYARRYRERGVENDDLVQEAMLGLCRAASTFNSTRGVPFIAYASIFINGRLKTVVANHPRFARLGPYPIVDKVDERTETLMSDIDLDDVHDAVGRLDEAELGVLTRRFGLDGGPSWTQVEMRERWGVSPFLQRRLMRRALRKIGNQVRKIA